ncbi:hypothetical protein D9M69_518990 [compost metagenome]
MNDSRRCGFSRVAAVMGVSITPGASAFTRTPAGASSCASDCVSILMAPFEGE